MKTSTSSVISTSDVSTKDRSSLTDRLTSITDEGMESVLWYIDWWVYSLKRCICPDMLSYIWACRWFRWIFPWPINDKVLPSRAEVLSCKYHPGVFCHPEQKYYIVSHPGVLDKSCDASIPCFSGQAATTEHQAELDGRTWGRDCAAVRFGQQPCPDTDQWWVWNCEKSGLSCCRRKLLPSFSLTLYLISYFLCYSKQQLLRLIKGQHLILR